MGSFSHARGDYGVLCERRSYLRCLATILFHLLEQRAAVSTVTPSKEGALYRVR